MASVSTATAKQQRTRRPITDIPYIEELRARFDGPQLFRINSAGTGGGDERCPYDVMEGIAIIHISGILSKMPHWWDETSYDEIQHEVGMATNDPNVNAILLNINSPGGETEGAYELADFLAKCGKKKPMWAVANPIAYSGAYLLAVQAEKIYVPPVTGGVGSIGVFSMHANISGMLEKAGIEVTILSAGEGKVDGNPYEPLSKSAREGILSEINRLYSAFVSSVAKGRNMSEDQVRSLGSYLYRGGQASITAGLADATGDISEAWLALVTKVDQDLSTTTALSTAPISPTEGTTSMEGNMNVATASAALHSITEDLVEPESRESQQMEKEMIMSTVKEPGKADATQAASPPDTSNANMSAVNEMSEIAFLCKMVGKPALAADFITQRMPLAEVRTRLMALAAENDGGEINNHPKQDPDSNTGSAANGIGGKFLIAACAKRAEQMKAMRGGQ